MRKSGWEVLLSRGALPLLLLIVLGAHAGAYPGAWHYDDYHHIVENPHLRSWRSVPGFFSDTTTFSKNPDAIIYRPLLLTSHFLNRKLTGTSPTGFFDVNLLLHLLTTTGVYLLARRLLQGPGAYGSGAHAPSLAAAALFGLHPVQVETVSYISSRSDGLSVCFMVFSVLLYLRWRCSLDIRPRLALTGSLTLFAAALLTKESAAVLPLILLGTEWILGGRGSSTIGILKRTFPYWACLLAYLALRQWAMPDLLARSAPIRPLDAHLLTQARALLAYLGKILLPTNLSIDVPFRVTTSLADPWAWVSLATLMGGTAAIPLLRHRLPGVSLGVQWFVCALLPTSLVRLKVALNYHRLYFPLVGLSLAVAAILSMEAVAGFYSRHRRICGPAAFTIAVLLAFGSYVYAASFRSEEAMWSRVLFLEPASDRALVSLGNAAEERGDRMTAIGYFTRAARANPYSAPAVMNIARIHLAEGRLKEAEIAAEQAAAVDMGTDALQVLAEVKRALGKNREALDIYSQVVSRATDHADVWANIGNLHLEDGRTNQARSSFERAIRIDPSLPHPYYGLALVAASEGRRVEARRDVETFLMLWRGDPATAARARALLASLQD